MRFKRERQTKLVLSLAVPAHCNCTAGAEVCVWLDSMHTRLFNKPARACHAGNKNSNSLRFFCHLLADQIGPSPTRLVCA